MNKSIWLFFIILIFSVITSAAPPFQTSDTSLYITFPKYDILKINNDHRFHVHVINDTRAKTNLTTQCVLHLYNQTGFDIFWGGMEWETYNGLDFAITLDGNNWSTVGTYSYVIQCNSSDQVGFVSGQLTATPTGSLYSTQSGLNFIGVLALFISIAFFLLIIGKEIEYPTGKVILFGLGGIIVFSGALFSMVVIDQTMFEFLDIIDGFATFLTILKILVGIFILLLLGLTIVYSYNLWQGKRGFK